MRRYEALREIMKAVTDEPLVCNLGHPAQELFAAGSTAEFLHAWVHGPCDKHRPRLALSQSKKVIVIDGDASVTMNMGGLATIGHTQPKNFVQIVIDNGANGSTGFQPSFTSDRLKLDQVARASGIEHVRVIAEQEHIAPILREVLKLERGPSVIVIRTDVGMPDGIAVIPLSPIEIKDRFMRALAAEEPRPVGRGNARNFNFDGA